MRGKGNTLMPILVLVADDLAVTAAAESRWLADLPQARRDTLAGWPDARARQQSLIGSRLLCQGLQRLGHRGDLLASLRHASGCRPTLDLPVYFSLSHCEGRVICAVSTAGPVGVDVEALGPLTAADFLLYLNAAERAWAGSDARRFLSVWTRKEAVAKAAGSRGLADLAQVDTGAAEQGAEFAGRLFDTVEIPVGEGHLAHLAMGVGAGLRAFMSVENVSRQSLENAEPPLVPHPDDVPTRLSFR